LEIKNTESHTEAPSLDSAKSESDSEDYIVDHRRMDFLMSAISELGRRQLELVAEDDDKNNKEALEQIDNTIARHKEELERLRRNASEVEIARESRRLDKAARILAEKIREDTYSENMYNYGMYGNPYTSIPNAKDLKFAEYLKRHESNPDHIVKPEKQDSYREDDYYANKLGDNPTLVN
jgi:hypothetical protein